MATRITWFDVKGKMLHGVEYANDLYTDKPHAEGNLSGFAFIKYPNAAYVTLVQTGDRQMVIRVNNDL